MNAFRAYVMGGLMLLFGVGIASRILTDKGSPALIGGFLNALANLFQNTING